MGVLSTFASVVSRQKSETVHQNVYVYKTLYVGSTVYFSSILYLIDVVYMERSCSRLLDLISLRQCQEYVYNFYCIIRRVSKIAKSDYLRGHARPSVCLHGTTRLPLEGFS